MQSTSDSHVDEHCTISCYAWHHRSVVAGCQNTKLTPLLDGAPNFRQVEGLPVYGVAIPTVRGLRNELEELGAAQGASGVNTANKQGLRPNAETQECSA